MSKQVAAAMVKAQKAFGPALKSSTNPHYKSKYADLAACVEAVITGLNDNGIALMQLCHECNDGVIVETMFVHESGETISAGKLHVPAQQQNPQGYGSALTYARRYGLMSACGIAPEDDDGNAASEKSKKATTEYIMPEQVAQINKMLKDTASNNAAFLKFIGAESVEKILSAHFEKAVTAIKAKKPVREPGSEG